MDKNNWKTIAMPRELFENILADPPSRRETAFLAALLLTCPSIIMGVFGKCKR